MGQRAACREVCAERSAAVRLFWAIGCLRLPHAAAELVLRPAAELVAELLASVAGESRAARVWALAEPFVWQPECAVALV